MRKFRKILPVCLLLIVSSSSVKSFADTKSCLDLFSTKSLKAELQVPERLRAVTSFEAYDYKGAIKNGIEIEGNLPKGVGRNRMAKDFYVALNRTMNELKAQDLGNTYTRIEVKSSSGRPESVYRPPSNAPEEHLTFNDGWSFTQHEYTGEPERPWRTSEGERIVPTQGRDHVEHVWKIVADHTAATEYGNDAELVSPILQSSLDNQIYYKTLYYVTRMTGFEPNVNAGVHVHVDFPKPKKEQLALLYWTFSKIENEVREALGMQPQFRDRYIRPLPKADEVISAEFLKKQSSLPKFMKEISVIAFSNLDGTFNAAKYHSLNITAIDKLGTVEFRIFPSTINAQRLQRYQAFCTKFVAMVRSKDSRFIELISRNDGAGDFHLSDIENLIGVSLTDGLDR